MGNPSSQIEGTIANSILEGSSFGIALFSLPDLKMVWHNSCFKRLTWFGRAEGGKRSTNVALSDLFLESEVAAVEKLVEISQKTGFSYDSDRTFLRGAKRTFQAKLSFRTFNTSEDEPGFICIEVVDLSLEKLYEELKNREEQLRKTQAELVQKSKMASVGEMAGGIAHEINNPLAIIDGRAHYLKLMIKDDEAIDKEKALGHIESICKTVRRAANIVKSIRSISEDHSKDGYQLVDLTTVMNTSLSIYKEKLKKEKIEFFVETPTKKTTILCNPAQISQVLLNLLKNAQEAVKRSNRPDMWVRVKTEISDQNIRIFVEDNGDGIPKSNRHRIMDPFFSTKDVGEGTGLGLSIANRLIDNHHGTINIHADAGFTGFEVVIPRKSALGKEEDQLESA